MGTMRVCQEHREGGVRVPARKAALWTLGAKGCMLALCRTLPTRWGLQADEWSKAICMHSELQDPPHSLGVASASLGHLPQSQTWLQDPPHSLGVASNASRAAIS